MRNYSSGSYKRGRNYKHGETSLSGGRSVEYKALQNAKARCTNPRHYAWENYGGRGIEFRFASLGEATKWIVENLGRRPDKYTLDRIDNDGHYEPGNLRWATRLEQNANKRHKYWTPAERMGNPAGACIGPEVAG